MHSAVKIYTGHRSEVKHFSAFHYYCICTFLKRNLSVSVMPLSLMNKMTNKVNQLKCSNVRQNFGRIGTFNNKWFTATITVLHYNSAIKQPHVIIFKHPSNICIIVLLSLSWFILFWKDKINYLSNHTDNKLSKQTLETTIKSARTI